MMVPADPDATRTELPEGATRAIALAALQATTGVRGAVPELPSRALTASARNSSSRSAKRAPSGDYRAEARARSGRRPPTGEEGDAKRTLAWMALHYRDPLVRLIRMKDLGNPYPLYSQIRAKPYRSLLGGEAVVSTYAGVDEVLRALLKVIGEASRAVKDAEPTHAAWTP